jgi:hypothetical protein
VRNARVLQLPQKMQICFDEYDQEAYEEEEEERSEIIEEGEDVEEEEEKGVDEDEDVDRLFYDTDEKLNNTSEEYFRGENIPR